MTSPTLGRWLLGFSIVSTVLVVAVADVFSPTHLFNPEWPPHARFHNAMQFSTLLLLSGVSLWGLSRGQHLVAALAPATFWPGLFMALPAPGTSVYATDGLRDVGIPVNLVIAAVWLVLTFVGYRLAARGHVLAPSGAAAPSPGDVVSTRHVSR